MIGKMALVFFIFAVFGYPYFAFISVFFGLPNTPVSIVYRTLLLGFGLTIISFSLLKDSFSLSKRGWMLLMFWIIYGILLVNDISLKDIRLRGESEFRLYTFIFGSTFLSFLTMLFGGRSIVLTRKFSWHIVQSIALIILLVSFISGVFSLPFSQIFRGRVMVSTEQSYGIINPILIGAFGSFLLIMSLTLLMIKSDRTLSFLKRILLICFSCLGLFGILISGSRGPVLIASTGFFILIIQYSFQRRMSYIQLLKLILSFILVFLIVIAGVIPILNNSNITVLSRITKSVEQREDGKLEPRDYEWKSAIDQFLSHPILGDKYVTDYDGFYPHNIYLEALMSTGIIGSSLLFIALYMCFCKIYKIWKLNLTSFYPIINLTIMIMVMGFTSGALHHSTAFWASLGLFCSIRLPNRPEQFQTLVYQK